LDVRGPYIKPAQYEALLAQVAEAGLIAPVGDSGYEFTEHGRSVLHEVEHAFYTRLSEVEPAPAERMAQLEGGLAQLVEASLAAAEPADKPGLSVVYEGHPGQAYGPLARIDQRLDDLSAFRDDVHLAAWQPYGVSGQAWEALTFVWRGDAATAEELAERLSFRGYSVEEYAAALTDLVERGWVERTADGYRVTEQGQALRQEAEDTTDRLFYAPWASLGVGDMAQLSANLVELRDGLRGMVEEGGGGT
jgi:ribosomal protein S19E (S16A)